MVTIFEVAKLQDVYERIDRTNSASDKKVIALCETFRKKADISINQAIRIARREINLSQILSICKITQGNLDQAYVCADEFSYTFGIRRETACAAIQDINERLAEAIMFRQSKGASLVIITKNTFLVVLKNLYKLKMWQGF